MNLLPSPYKEETNNVILRVIVKEIEEPFLEIVYIKAQIKKERRKGKQKTIPVTESHLYKKS